jgi:hypothetical protein
VRGEAGRGEELNELKKEELQEVDEQKDMQPEEVEVDSTCCLRSYPGRVR